MTTRRSRTTRAFVRRAVKLARQRPDGIVSSGEVAYAQCRSTMAYSYDSQVAMALYNSRRFERVEACSYYGRPMGGVSLFKLREVV